MRKVRRSLRNINVLHWTKGSRRRSAELSRKARSEFLRNEDEGLNEHAEDRVEARSSLRTRVLAVTTACHAVNHMFWESLGPLLPFLIVAFDLNHTEAGRLGFVSSAVYGLMNYPSGHLSDKYGKRLLILLFLLISSGATLLMVFSASYLQIPIDLIESVPIGKGAIRMRSILLPLTIWRRK